MTQTKHFWDFEAYFKRKKYCQQLFGFEINLTSYHIIELFMLINDIIPGKRFDYSADDKKIPKEVIRIVKKLGLKYRPFSLIYRKKRYIAVSKSQSVLDDFHKTDWAHNTATKCLGFPPCCVKYHKKRSLISRGPESPTFFQTLSNTQGKPSFYLNNLFHPTFAHLIPHFSCSLNCPESMKIAKKTLNAIHKKSPELANFIRKLLKSTVTIKKDKNSEFGIVSDYNILLKTSNIIFTNHDFNSTDLSKDYITMKFV